MQIKTNSFYADMLVKVGFLQDKYIWMRRCCFSIARAAHETPFDSAIHTKDSAFHRLQENQFLSYLKDRELPVWVKRQTLKAYFGSLWPEPANPMSAMKGREQKTGTDSVALYASHTAGQAGLGYFSQALAQLHVPAPS